MIISTSMFDPNKNERKKEKQGHSACSVRATISQSQKQDEQFVMHIQNEKLQYNFAILKP